MTPAQVFALRPPADSRYRLTWTRERLQDTFRSGWAEGPGLCRR